MTPRTRLRGTRTISLKLPTGAKSEPQTGIDPRSDRRWLSVLCRRVLHARHSTCGLDRAVLVVRSRQVRVAGVARAVRVWVGPGAIRWPGVQASSGIDCRRQPLQSALSSQLATPARCRIVFGLRHGRQAFPSLWWVRAERKRGQNPRAFNHVGTQPPSRWGNARRSTAPAPQSRPVTPASRLVAQTTPLVACGLGLKSWPQGQLA